MEALILLSGVCWSDSPAWQTEAIGFCLDQTLGLQRENPQYIHSAGLSYVSSFSGSLMFRMPVCSLKRGNSFFQTFYSISTAMIQLLHSPKISEEPCRHVNSPFLQGGQVEYWAGKRKRRILKGFLSQICPTHSFCSSSLGLWATGGSRNQERSLLIIPQMFAVQGIKKRPSQPRDARSP